jgi:hypothetical protein
MRRHAFGQPLEALIGAKGIALAREHTRGILTLALEGEHTRGVGVGARHILLEQEAQDLAVVLEARQRHLAADLHHVLGLRVQLLGLRPLFQQLGRGGVEFAALGRNQLVEARNRPPGRRKQGLGRLQCLTFMRQARLAPDLAVELAQRFGYLRQVAHPLGRHDGAAARRHLHRNLGQSSRTQPQTHLRQARKNRLIQRRDPVVVETRGHGAEDRHAVRRLG